jgi:predicted alpha/beta hydrolase family esterase
MQNNKPMILILHGIGGHAGIHWGQWLHDELEKQGFQVTMPSLSNSKHPDRQQWLAEIKQSASELDTDKLIIVGHSLGVTSALDFIEQSSTSVRGLVSVSGFAIDYGAELNSYFLKEKSIDFQKANTVLGKAVVFYGDDDPYVTQEALKQLSDALDVKPVVINGGGHLNTERGYTTFPQLLDAVLQMEIESSDKFSEVVKIMANTPPISNKELVKRSKQRKS